jgi:hypothetical protein
LEEYKQILLQTNAHLQGYDASRHINSNKGYKYTHIIKPLMKRRGKVYY